MPLVVVDPRVQATAWAYNSAEQAGLIALLAYGRVCAYTSEVAEDERKAMEDKVADRGGEVLGRAVEAAQEEAATRRRRMEEVLGHGAPDELLLITSVPV